MKGGVIKELAVDVKNGNGYGYDIVSRHVFVNVASARLKVDDVRKVERVLLTW